MNTRCRASIHSRKGHVYARHDQRLRFAAILPVEEVHTNLPCNTVISCRGLMADLSYPFTKEAIWVAQLRNFALD